MCEPYHSIVQYPDDYDDTNLPFGGNMDKESRLKAALGKAFGWTRKFGKWFHLSKFGAGHSGATRENHHTSLYLPRATLWEGEWWNRKLNLDSWRPTGDEQLAKDAAVQYHDASAMGNMSLFRRFLETSMRKTQHPHGPYTYTERLMDDVLTKEGRDLLWKKMKSIFNLNSQTMFGRSFYKQAKGRPEQLIKITMGFTRKRSLFLPHFSDDANLWT